MSVTTPNRWFLSLALAALVATAAMPAARAADANTVSLRVSAADLDLRTSAGQATLRHRIAVAALKVCEAAMDGDMLEDCPWQARHRAAPQVNAMIASAEGQGQAANLLASAAPAP
jgi:UrcA family protein